MKQMGYLYLAGGIAALIGTWLMKARASDAAAVLLFILGSGLLVAAWRRLRQTTDMAAMQDHITFEVEGLSQEDGDLLQESYTKAVNDFNFLEEAQGRITDSSLAQQLSKMQGIARHLLTYLQEHPQKVSLARRFIDYYQDRSVVLVKKYFELENTNLATDNVQEMKQRIRAMLFSMDEAYEEQFNKVLNEQLMDMDAELQVMKQTIEADGIKVEEPAAPTERPVADTAAGGNETAAMGPLPAAATDEPHVLINRGGRHGRRHVQTAASTASEMPESDIVRKKIIAGALGIVFGLFGAHKFYLGKTKSGIFYIIFFWTGLPAIVGFIEGIRYLFMPVASFYQQYLDR